jgi:predicted lipoprotein with Yx(FWY)xxD motif
MLSRQGATRRVSLALLCAGTLGLAAGCSSTSPGTSSTGEAAKGSGQAVKVDVRSVPGVGPVLVTGKGYVLYVFEPDHHRTVTCTGACAGTWPPLMESSGADLIGGPGVQQALFGSDPDPVGGRVVTYAGWPLYGYTGDLQPGQATGQDIDTNGGEWYVIRPSGQLVETEP